jgi:hypothetical protein
LLSQRLQQVRLLLRPRRLPPEHHRLGLRQSETMRQVRLGLRGHSDRHLEQQLQGRRPQEPLGLRHRALQPRVGQLPGHQLPGHQLPVLQQPVEFPRRVLLDLS